MSKQTPPEGWTNEPNHTPNRNAYYWMTGTDPAAHVEVVRVFVFEEGCFAIHSTDPDFPTLYSDSPEFLAAELWFKPIKQQEHPVERENRG